MVELGGTSSMERPFTWQIDELGLEVTVRHRPEADAPAPPPAAGAFVSQLAALAAELRQPVELMVDRMSESNPLRRDAVGLLDTLDRLDRVVGRLRAVSRASHSGEGTAGAALVAVDDPETRSLAQLVLERLGWRVTPANALGENDSVDVLVADAVAASGEHGLRLAARLRARRPGLCAVLLGAFVGVEAAERLEPEVAFVAAPPTEEALAAALEALQARG